MKTKRGYQFDWYHPETRIRHRKVLPARTKREAEELFEKYRKEQLGLAPHSHAQSNIIIREAIDEYYIVRSFQKRPRSQELDKKALETFAEIIGSHHRLKQIDEKIVALFVQKCQSKWAASSVNRISNTVRNFINWSVERGWLKTPIKVHRVKGEIRESRPLPLGTIQTIYEIAGPQLRLQILMALTWGLRRAEIASLTWRAIDFQSGRVQIGGIGGFITKSGESRNVYLTPTLKAALSTHRSKQSDSDWVFPNETNLGPVTAHNLTRQWGRARNTVGVKDAKFHDLRATAATNFAEDGHGDAMIASLLGHKTVLMARKYSNRVQEDNRRNAFLKTDQSICSHLENGNSPICMPTPIFREGSKG